MKRNFANLFFTFVILLNLLAWVPVQPVRAGTLTVTNTNDSGAGSLRQVILDAINGDTIDVTGVSGTITLSSEIVINKNLTIQGPGSSQLNVSGNNVTRVFKVEAGKTVSISGLTITNGRVVDFHGAGINNSGNLTLNNVNVINNIVESSGSPYNRGGGIYVHDAASLTMTNGIVSGNTATQHGGGIHVSFNASISLDNVVIDNNDLTDINSTGGGISIRSGSTATLNNMAIQNNSAKNGGGGVYADTSITITNSSVTNNAVTSGAGGGLYLSGTASTLENVTISGNSVSNPNNNAIGGGINLIAPAILNMNNVTVVNNLSQGQSAGVHIQNSATLNIGNSIIAENNASNHVNDDCSGIMNSLGHNLIQITTGCTINGTTTGNITASAPELAPLSNYGGSTLTHALLFNSPALDAADNATCEAADQRGISRPQDGDNDSTGTCDIGAYEHVYDSIAPTISSIVRASTSPTSASSVDFTVTFSEPVTGVDVDGSDFELVTSGVSGAAITAVTPVSASIYTVSVNTGSGDGSIRLDLPASASISDLSANPLSNLPFTSGETYSINKSSPLPSSPTFEDVPMNHPYWEDVEILYANGLTAGCSTTSLLFCPDMTMNRAQSAVFMVRGNFGISYSPPPAPWTTFGDDFSPGPWAQPWAQGMFDAGLTAGCSTNPRLFCPWEQMPRFQAAVFGLRLKYGIAYPPPAGTGTVFADVNGSEWFAGWAEQAYSEGMLPACGSSAGKPLFCPDQLVSRGLAAYMIVRAKNLSMP